MKDVRTTLGSCAILLPLLLASAAPALATNSRTFVSTSGSDTGTCGATTPCRTFGYALTQTSAGGELVILASGGYGPVTIGQSVTLVGEGVHPSVTALTGDAIAIAATGAAVTLRGLNLIGQGATNGVHVTAAASVLLQDMTISGFSNGVNVSIASTTSTPPTPLVHIKNSVIKGNSVNGVVATGTSSGLVTVNIESCQVLENTVGVLAQDQGHVVIDSSDVLYGTTAIEANAANTGTAASVDVLYSNIGFDSASVVSVNAVAGSTAAVFLSANTIFDAISATNTFVGGTACAPSNTNTSPTCTITSDGSNLATNQGDKGGAAPITGSFSESPAGMLSSSGSSF